MSEAHALARTLAGLVDVLLPGDELFPPASQVGVQAKLADRLIELRGASAPADLVRLLETAGQSLAGLDRAGWTALIEQFEHDHPEDFLLLRDIAYLAYYESPAVHEAIRAMGFTYHAMPLPEGYDVGRFDPSTDMPRHARGRFIRTEEVRRVDLSGLDFVGGGNG
jgi:hypothetical protein